MINGTKNDLCRVCLHIFFLVEQYGHYELTTDKLKNQCLKFIFIKTRFILFRRVFTQPGALKTEQLIYRQCSLLVLELKVSINL